MTTDADREPRPVPVSSPMSNSVSSGGAILLRIVFGAVFVLYPLVVWWALSRGSPRAAAITILAAAVPLALWRWHSTGRKSLRGLGLLPFATVITLGLGAALDSAGFVLAVPTIVNAVLLVGFGLTLRSGSIPMIERFARMQLADPTSAQMRWCRAWTWIWCGFFVANGTVAAVLALWAPLAWWAAYTGGLAYVGIGALLAIEWMLRRRRFGPA